MTQTLFKTDIGTGGIDPHDAFDVLSPGQFKVVAAPVHGRQHTGVCPGGPVDRFSVQTGNIMLGNPDFFPALEIVSPPVLQFRQDSLFIVTGARCANMRLVRNSTGNPWPTDVAPGRVEFAQRGDRLSFGEKEYGYRAYLCHAPCRGEAAEELRERIGRTRGVYRDISRWADPEGRIRAVEGPEYSAWLNPEILLEQVAYTAKEVGDAGLPLTTLSGERPQVNVAGMIYGALNDGAIQATPQGLIVLLRNRQTIAGLPRILNVIGPDIDLLAQFGPDQVVRIHKVSMSEALSACRRRKSDLDAFRKKWNP